MLPEAAQYMETTESLIEEIINLIKELSVGELDWKPVENVEDYAVNSLAMIAAHVSGAARFLGLGVVGQLGVDRDHDEEFSTQGVSADELVGRFRITVEELRGVYVGLTEDDINGTRDLRGRTVATRWALVHIIDHSALHLGHMQLTYQLGQNGQGGASPR